MERTVLSTNQICPDNALGDASLPQIWVVNVRPGGARFVSLLKVTLLKSETALYTGSFFRKVHLIGKTGSRE